MTIRADRVLVAGVGFDSLTQEQLVEHVAAAIAHGDGGTIVTPNVDICRRARRDPASAGLVAAATVVVPDGTPLLWAARVAGRPLAERITGADLIFALCEAAAARDWPVYLLGGRPGEDGGPGAAELAALNLTGRYQDLRVAGAGAPPLGFDARGADITGIRDELVAAKPAIVFVGLGFPKQEQLIARLRGDLPQAWFVGCGAAIPFAAGTLRRAPSWAQRIGMEWLYRLVGEPRRLARRYLVDDLPFAIVLLAASAWQRLSRIRLRPARDGATSSRT